MTSHITTPSDDRLDDLIEVRPISIDDFSALRYLFAKSLISQAADVISDEEATRLVRFIYSPDYSDHVMDEQMMGAFFDGELVGSAAWHAGRDTGVVARVGPIFVRHPRLGIGRRLLAAVEARAREAGFRHFASWSTGHALPFFQAMGYQVTSRGAKTFTPGYTLTVSFLRKVVV